MVITLKQALGCSVTLAILLCTPPPALPPQAAENNLLQFNYILKTFQ